MACKGEQLEMVQYLLLKAMNPNLPNKLQMTPLFYAVENNCDKIVTLMLGDKRL